MFIGVFHVKHLGRLSTEYEAPVGNTFHVEQGRLSRVAGPRRSELGSESSVVSLMMSAALVVALASSAAVGVAKRELRRPMRVT